MSKRLVLVCTVLAALAGCASGVRLVDAPVEDLTAPRSGSDVPSSFVAPNEAAVPGDRTDADSSVKAIAAPVAAESVVYFDYDSYVIKPEFQDLLAAHARWLKARPAVSVTIEGHTDERGGREYNLALGQRRAEAVSRALALLGVASAQVEPVSFGEEKPAAAGTEEESLGRNRRAEIRYR